MVPPPRDSRSRPPVRQRTDRCPGVLRPWPAEDGALVRLRVPGGQVSVAALEALLGCAEEYGDGRAHVTGRANLQLRSLPSVDGALPAAVVAAIEATGLAPSRSHDLVRNVLASPQTGLSGGRADLRPVVAELDRRLRGEPRLAALPGRFLFTLDDGRGDLVDRHRDLGLVALEPTAARLLVGRDDGPVVGLEEAPALLVRLALEFLHLRGEGPAAPWHVEELTDQARARWCRDSSVAGLRAAPGVERDRRTSAAGLLPHDALPHDALPHGALPYGPVPGGWHEDVEHGITGADAQRWARLTDTVVLTPWRGVLVPDLPAEGTAR